VGCHAPFAPRPIARPAIRPGDAIYLASRTHVRSIAGILHIADCPVCIRGRKIYHVFEKQLGEAFGSRRGSTGCVPTVGLTPPRDCERSLKEFVR